MQHISNQMQVALGQVLIRVFALVQAAIGCCILLLLTTSSQEGLDSLQLALVVFFLPSTNAKT